MKKLEPIKDSVAFIFMLPFVLILVLFTNFLSEEQEALLRWEPEEPVKWDDDDHWHKWAQ
jgi:hypothetical protein